MRGRAAWERSWRTTSSPTPGLGVASFFNHSPLVSVVSFGFLEGPKI